MPFDPLTAISSVDGRYHAATGELADYFSEFALIRARIRVETEYLIALSEKGVIRGLTGEEKGLLQRLQNISLEDAKEVKEIEKTTNHDVKAVEYFLKQRIKGTSLEEESEWIHFGLTSEDINSVAYGLLLRDFFERSLLGGPLADIEKNLTDLVQAHAATPMLARTHGQPASPTTFGKEMAVFLARLHRQVDISKTNSVLVKFGGATGNYNAHAIAKPDIDWPAFADEFVERFNQEGEGKKHYKRLGLNPVTTQIEPHDTYAEYFDSMRRINTVLVDLSQDMWRYISDGWIIQKPKDGEVGSSAMPHKVNPIDFENAEGNLGIANALFNHFSTKLPISRLQRDLSDSTVERAFGTAFAHTVIAYKSLAKGFGKIQVNEQAMLEALRSHPEVLAEAIQTVLRANGAEMPYEKLKELTRGKQVTLEDLQTFVDGLDVSLEIKQKLKDLSPEQYIGLAAQIAKK
ncbi:adenylosuccinate lyase [Candidatus Parcubacteria bacterium]|nr:MAG: adenylosuccinate lyase [Candidatus Parcubacteria bacterium]